MKRLFLLKTLTLAFFLLAGVGNAWGQTTLSSSELALIGMDTPDEDFSFVVFVDLDAGTEIYFTDEEADADYTIGTGEGTVLYTAPIGGITAGTVITYGGNSSNFATTSDGDITLANDGDGLIAYQGSSLGSVTTYLHGIAKNLKLLGTFPDGFSNYMTFGADDGEFNGTRTGTAVELMTAINISSNWTTSGSGVIPFNTTPFTITSGGGPSAPTALTIAQTTSDKMQITWTKPTGTHATDWDGVVVFLTDGSNGVALSESGEDGIDYSASTTYGSGTNVTDAGYNDDGYCVANQTTDANGDIIVTGLTDGNIYYVYAYTYKEVTGDNNDDVWSSEANGGSDVAEVSEISAYTVTPGDQQLELSWANPSGSVNIWWDKVVIIAREGAAVEAAINKGNFDGLVDGSVTAESDWTASPGHSNSDVYNQTAVGSDNTNYFIYNETLTTATITGLSNGTTYYFKAMVYYEDGSSADIWSDGIIASGIPTNSIEPILGDLIISELCGTGTNAGDGFMEIFNTTSESISLDNVQARYWNSNPTGATPSTTIDLSGSIPAYGSIVIARNASDFNTYYGFSADFSNTDFFFNGQDDGCDIYLTTTTTVLDEFNDNGTTASGNVAWDWNDGSVWERTITGSGAVLSNWTEYASGAGTPQALLTVTFNENTNSDWNTVTNWDEIIPGSYQNIDIPSAKNAQIAATETANCYNLMVNGTLTIESNSSNTGSLIINGSVSSSGTITSQRYMSGSETWRLISSPVINQFISDVNNWTPSGSYTGGHGYDFYAYQESTAEWLNQKVGDNDITNFTPGQGYLVSFEAADQTKTFTGNLNNGDVVVSVSKTGTGDYAGANLIGNPYPSGIDWNNADRSLFSDNYAYVYDRVSNSGETYEGYALVNGSAADAFIAPHQGFFVIKSATGLADFTFTNAMRVHGGTFSKNPTTFSGLKLKVSNGSYYDLATIQLNEFASFDRDRMDAIKFYSNNASMPNFYAVSKDSKQLAINTIPLIDIEEPIVMGVTIPADGIYEISLYELGTDFSDEVLYIEDLLTGAKHNLTNDGSYSFSAVETDSPDRFLLHFGAVGIGEQDQATTLNAYVYNNRLYVNNSLEKAQLAIYDLQGRLLVQQAINVAGLQALPLNLPAGIYVLQLSNAQQAQSVKISIQ